MIHEDTYNKLVFIKIKNFYSAKNNVKRVRRQATNGRKHFWKIFDKQLLKLSNKYTNSLLNNWAKILNRYLTKEHILTADKNTTRCFYIIKEMQIKIMRYYCIPIRKKARALTIPNAGESVKQQGLWSIGDENASLSHQDKGFRERKWHVSTLGLKLRSTEEFLTKERTSKLGDGSVWVFWNHQNISAKRK